MSGGRSLPKHLQNRKTCAKMLIFVPKRLQNAAFSIFDLRFILLENYLLVDYLCYGIENGILHAMLLA